jgi:hypothetical protein
MGAPFPLRALLGALGLTPADLTGGSSKERQ